MSRGPRAQQGLTAESADFQLTGGQALPPTSCVASGKFCTFPLPLSVTFGLLHFFRILSLPSFACVIYALLSVKFELGQQVFHRTRSGDPWCASVTPSVGHLCSVLGCLVSGPIRLSATQERTLSLIHQCCLQLLAWGLAESRHLYLIDID